jgi:hypothetical protein
MLTMKTVKNIIAAVALVIVSANAFAGNGPTSKIASLMREVKSKISLETSKNNAGKKVNFTFTVNAAGNVDAVMAKVENLQDRQILEAQFAKMNFPKLAQGVTYNMDVNFINY